MPIKRRLLFHWALATRMFYLGFRRINGHMCDGVNLLLQPFTFVFSLTQSAYDDIMMVPYSRATLGNS